MTEEAKAPTTPAPKPDLDTGTNGNHPWRRRRGLASVSLAVVVLCGLVVLAVLSIIGGLVFGGNTPLGKACVIGFSPVSSIAIGIAANHLYSKRGLDERLAREVQNALYTTLHLKRSVLYVDDRLGAAREHLEDSRVLNALLELVQAKTATELSLGTAQQSSRQWESISKPGAQAALSLFAEDDDQWRPRIRQGNNPKTVALSDDRAGEDDASA